MVPPRIRALGEDSRSEASSTRDKQPNGFVASKSRRNGNSAVTTGSTLKDVTAAPITTNHHHGGHDGTSGINWSTFDVTVLHAYRQAHRLNVPSAFSSPFNERVLTRSRIGQSSPTMAGRKDSRRTSKEHLALAVRKDFNAAMINEPDAITSFLYAAHSQEKNFRMRFDPLRIK